MDKNSQTLPSVGLPFVVDDNHWHVSPTGNYYADAALGRCFAQSVFEVLDEYDSAIQIFDWIVESQIKHHTDADKNIRTAFWQHVAFAVKHRVLDKER